MFVEPCPDQRFCGAVALKHLPALLMLITALWMAEIFYQHTQSGSLLDQLLSAVVVVGLWPDDPQQRLRKRLEALQKWVRRWSTGMPLPTEHPLEVWPPPGGQNVRMHSTPALPTRSPDLTARRLAPTAVVSAPLPATPDPKRFPQRPPLRVHLTAHGLPDGAQLEFTARSGTLLGGSFSVRLSRQNVVQVQREAEIGEAHLQ
ncbi:hypothetical protein MF271_24500 (plasmid) [Deinococcus sp. KNUC1210]|uniref:hypothetical protein n=1 Tax=Deinococcus sp. KNUC1210 TaxID=2917691 RepID=UPI001EF0A41A|nr:hypothetical protein [Deinococcus sp. KNUC1210]ULH18117.1 hypothetical protein MF271_24500 [Deinococcus sp. KNUC1210]